MSWQLLVRTLCFKLYLSSEIHLYLFQGRTGHGAFHAPLDPVMRVHHVTEGHFRSHILKLMLLMAGRPA